MMKFKRHLLRDQHLILLADRALFWEDEKILILADAHFGKAQIFRDGGIPVPAGTTAEDVKRLSHLMERLCPDSVLFLGDLIHGRMDNTGSFNRLIGRWRRRHRDVQFLLVSGNHDLRSGEPPPQFRFDRISGELVIDPFIFTHKPKLDASYYGIAGHVHPAVIATGSGRQKEILPCFCFGTRNALLPAFGGFTGNQVIRPKQDDRIYVVAGEEVFEMH